MLHKKKGIRQGDLEARLGKKIIEKSKSRQVLGKKTW